MRNIRSLLNSRAMLVVFQMLGLAIPLLTLPYLARTLGVAEFGKVMLSQAIVFFGVVFIDAGFNTESQRRVALAKDQAQRLQVLFDNLSTRALCALPAAAVILGASFFFHDVPFQYVVVALLHIVGTLVFPQWWLIGSNMGLQMGLASTTGRLIAAALTLTLVRTSGDGLLAVAAASSGTFWAGMFVAPAIYKKWKLPDVQINRKVWRNYFMAVRPTIVSGFFSSATSSVPAVLLGWIAGITQVGFYSAADRLTRAAAHLIGVVEQSLMGPLARAEQGNLASGQKLRKKLMFFLAFATGLGWLVVGFGASGIIHLLYGDKFAPVADLLRLLCMWLWFYVMRRASLLFTWSLRGNLIAVSRFQWLEALCVTSFATIGAILGAAKGLTIGLLACEITLVLALWIALRRERLEI